MIATRAATGMFVLALAACADLRPLACHGGERALVVDTLYFGTATPDGTVSAAQWKDFVDGTLTPRFPDGLTIAPAAGQWRSANGAIVREASWVVTLAHRDDAASDASVGAIIGAYKARFRQEAVLRLRTPACASP